MPAGGKGLLAHRLDEAASGPGAETLLLLNGGFMSIAAWAPFVEPLGASFRLLRCDFRGQLLTGGRGYRELAGNVEDLVALLDHLGLERVHLLGTSFGGEVGLLLAARQPERVASLVAVTVGDRATEAMRESGRALRQVIADLLAGGDPGLFHDALVPEVYSPSYVEANAAGLIERRGQIARFPATWFEALDDLLTAVETFDLRPEIGRIRCPTLVVAAGGDRVTPPEQARAIVEAIPGAVLAEHPESGHVLILEQTEWLVEQVLAFHRGLAAGVPGAGRGPGDQRAAAERAS